MSYERFVGMRYLMAKKRSSVVSIITLISITGVALGVTALIVVLSVMGGFKKDLKEKILGTKAHIVVQAHDGTLLDDAPEVARRTLEVEGVLGASPFFESEVMVSSAAGLNGVMLRGIVPASIADVSEIRDHIQEGSLDYLLDDRPLMKELDAQRARELDELLDKINDERNEIREERERLGQVTSSPPPPGDLVDPLLGKQEVEQEDAPSLRLELGEEDRKKKVEQVDGAREEGSPQVALPPIKTMLSDAAEEAEQKGVNSRQYEIARPLDEADDIPQLPGDDTGAMPSMFGEEDGFDEEDESEGMPPLPGQEDEEELAQGSRLPGMIIGRELAKSLQVGLGDELNVVTLNGDIGPSGRMPRSRPFRVVGIFYSGMYEYDANFGYTRLEDATDFIGVKGATGVELKTTDVEHALDIAQEVQDALDPDRERYDVLDWMELNRSLFYALKLEKIAMFVVLTFIILVASFSIVAMLIMIVIEKGREIAVLKSLGATNAGIMRTFILQGTVIGAVGAAFGLVLGLLICYLLEEVGFPLNSEVYYISTLPIDMNWGEVVSVVVCAIVISVLATIYPSIQAARLRPVDGLRDD